MPEIEAAKIIAEGLKLIAEALRESNMAIEDLANAIRETKE